MKNITFILLSLFFFGISSCKKKGSSTPGISGTWKLANVSGTSSINLTTSTGASTVYSYEAGSSTLTETVTYPTSSTQSISIYQLVSEQWTFNNSGSYSLYEIYINSPGSSNLPDTTSTAGNWNYQSGNQSNLYLGNGISYILANVTNSNSYTVTSLSGSTLELTVSNSQNNSGAVTATDVTLTFTR
jgi:hypothetical protein